MTETPMTPMTETPPADPLLALDRVEIGLAADPQVRAVDGLDLRVALGEAVALVGESGSGKSVTAYAALGRLAPALRASGTLRLGASSYDLGDPEALRPLRGGEISMIFQDPGTSLNPVMTVGRQLEDVLRRHGGPPRRERWRRVVDLLAEVGVAAPDRVARAYPFELSGGMRQRVLIAMALSCEPRLLIADEPTTALDTTVQAQIMDLLMTLVRDRGMAMLFISHDLGLVAGSCRRMYVMYAGRVVESGPVADVLRRPRHPYTKALVGCRPTADRRLARLPSIPGTVPPIGSMPSGCRFAPRCPIAVEQCRTADPELRAVGGNVSAACLRASEEES
ncbi:MULTISPECIES: ABC transporter ATP-binding protein [unclassified Nonomuraea]|uniref:ABC transporter ATP-binding protein n=1 Tax=unclassified Nonomuraea TaxID=2593643 RepID=UPI00191C0E2D|nr:MULTISPECIES: ABC transporter ATP-binding protein [unclassified Nonomuraea]